MKNKIQKISPKLLTAAVIFLFSTVMVLILAFIQNHIKEGLVEQNMAKRWSDQKDASQVSVFYGNGEVEDTAYFRSIGEKIDQALITASISQEEGNETARLWMDTVSRNGKITITSALGKAEVTGVGVEGDFFQFHPIPVVNGTYFTDLSHMRDVVMLDKETAWQLFGSFDITGMEVKIGEIPHIVVGVFERPKGRLEEAAGLDQSICYLSMDSLEAYGTSLGGYTYEIVLPNPIKNFGVSTVTTAVTADKKDTVIVENSTRYDIMPLLLVAKSFGTRSMSKQGIIFPYWENIARGQEDLMAALLVTELCFLLLISVIFLAVLIRCYRRRTWSLGQMIEFLKDKHYEMGTKRMQKKQERSALRETLENESGNTKKPSKEI